MASPLRETALTYLREHNVMTLATQGPAGVWAAAVFYVNDGFDLYFLSAPETRHCRNIAGQPLVAATIQEDYAEWQEIKGIQLEGNAKAIRGEERSVAIARYLEKYPFVAGDDSTPEEITAAMARVEWYKVTPSRLYLIDNSRGLGHRDEVLE